jgi:transcriptional regulator
MTLYQPRHFVVEERPQVLALMRTHPFATLLSVHEGEIEVTHLPLVTKVDGDAITLLGHVARANPHWQRWPAGATVTAIFHGPHAYVSPSWYTTREAVPTWNYLVVHAEGRIQVTHDSAAKEAILKALIDAHDPAYRSQWDDELTEEYREGLKRGIVGFEIAVAKLNAKFKLSQNRPTQDRANVAEQLARAPATAEVAAWMRRLA